MKIKQICAMLLCLMLTASLFAGCGKSKEKILVYTSIEDYVIEDMQPKLKEKFPDYDIVIEYFSTGDLSAKLLAEGTDSDCDIIYSLEYPYLQKLDSQGFLTNLTDIIDNSVFSDDVLLSDNFVPQCRNGGAIILNTDILKEKNLPEPACYEDLLNPIYKDLVSMPNPKSSGTGYMFLLSLINSMGEDAAFEYFDKLSENIFQFTSSGSGPINAILQGEAAIGLGMTGQAVLKITTENAPIKILYFEEGSPYSMYGQGILEGKQNRESVKEVFTYLATDYAEDVCEQFYPERIFKDKTFNVENYPTDIKYADMSEYNTPDEKERLLAKWKY